MRRDYLIAIILAVAAIPAGAALMVAPDYLHLSGVAIPLTFWGGLSLTIALILAAAIVALRGEVKSIQEANMTAADVGYNAALVAASVALIAALRRAPRAAIIACVVAWAGVGVDYWLGPPRGWIFTFGPTVPTETFNWFAFVRADDSQDKPPRYSSIELLSTNQSSDAIKLDDAYIISGITGEEIHLMVQLIGGGQVSVGDINLIPIEALIILSAKLDATKMGIPKG